MLHSKVTSLALLLAIFWCCSVAVCAQSATATLNGFVTDSAGGYLPGAKIKVQNIATQWEVETETNKAGYFVFSLLPPGIYIVFGQCQDFAPVEFRNIVLNVNDNRSLRIVLKPGAITDSILVTDQVPLLQESATVSTVVDRKMVENLPLNGRSFQSLISLSPGVVMANTSNGGTGGQFSVNGQRANANAFIIDGVSANFGVTPGAFSLVGNGSTPAVSVLGGTNNLVSIDALEEFRLQTSNYALEFGRMPGGQVSLVTRSGTNQWHGTLFDYLRNDVLDANDWFANQKGLPRPPMRQNDFGGVLGGPVRKDRTFFFFSYEGLRLRLPQFLTTAVPSLSLRQEVSPAMQSMLNLFPRPNGSEYLNANGSPQGLAPFSASFSDPSSLNATSLRLDHRVNDRLHLSARYNYAPSESRNRIEGSLNTINGAQFLTKTLTGSAIYSPTAKLNNEFRLNWSRSNVAGGYEMDDFGGAQPLPGKALLPSFATTADSLFTFQLGFPGPFLAVGRDYDRAQRQFNLVNNLTSTTGGHQWKFGIDYRRLTPVYKPTKFNLRFDVLDYDPAVSIPFLRSGQVFAWQIASEGPFFPIFDNLSLFAQDTWRITPRLTMTYGLRWEYNPPPSERNNRFPYSATGFNNPTTIQIDRTGNPYPKPARDNFAPRVGLAYQMSSGQWARTFRGGIGVYYDLGTDNAGSDYMYTNSPFQIVQFEPGVVRLPLNLSALQPLPFDGAPPWAVRVYEPNFKAPYTLQWNATIEQSLGTQQSVTASYVGSAGRRLIWNEFNFLLPTTPDFLVANISRNTSTSDYHALQLQYQRRLSRGLQLLASHSWAHAIDNNSDGVRELRPLTALEAARQTNLRQERGNSDFDIRHSFVASLVCEIPTLRTGKVLSAVVKDWSLAPIIRLQSGPPLDVYADYRAASRPDLVPGQAIFIADPNVAGGRKLNRAAFAVPTEPQQGTLGRNVLRDFGFAQTDLAVQRQLSLTERMKLQFRAEFFNLFNHPNFTMNSSFNNYLPDPRFGQATRMLGRGLGGGFPGFGMNPLHQVGGPRSTQVALKLSF